MTPLEKAEEQVNDLRAEAKRCLNGALDVPEYISATAIDRAVDAIIAAAVLQVAITQGRAFDVK